MFKQIDITLLSDVYDGQHTIVWFWTCQNNIMHVLLKIEETFAQDFLEILKRTLQNFQKIWKYCFIVACIS